MKFIQKIEMSSILVPMDKPIGAIHQSISSLKFNCPINTLKKIDSIAFLAFCDPIFVIPTTMPEKFELCAGFRTYQIFLELDINPLQVIVIDELSPEEVIQFSYFATLVPLLVYSSPSTHAQHDIKQLLKDLIKTFPQAKALLASYSKLTSKFQSRKRSLKNDTALHLLLKALREKEEKNG